MKKLKKNQGGVGLGSPAQYLIEEGEWYPTLYGETTGVGVQMALNPTPIQRYDFVQGRYQRVGNMCWLGAYVYISDKNGASGNVLIGGLPYPYGVAGTNFIPTSFLVTYAYGITLTPPINLYSVVCPSTPITPKALKITGWETLTQTAQTVTVAMCNNDFGIEFTGWYPIEQ